MLKIALAQIPSNTITLIPLQHQEDVFSLVYQYMPEQADLALRIIKAESSFVINATTSLSSAKGLAQIIDGTARHYKCEGSMLEAEPNIRCMAKILKDGTGAWESSRKNWK